jgi:hypothetical protein
MGEVVVVVAVVVAIVVAVVIVIFKPLIADPVFL